MKTLLPVCCLLIVSFSGSAQSQVCPLNSNFSLGNLTHWRAYTGNNSSGNGPDAIKQWYDSTVAAPTGTLGNTTIYEYNLPSTVGIQILSASTKDPYGGFQTVPTINGYKYTNTILLGSTAITRANSPTGGGGYVRGVTYRINVPPGDYPGQPYTMTYAYAMVLENGTHNSNDQPLFTATLKIGDSVVQCASPRYFLPTFNNATPQDQRATLDSALAKKEGFVWSSRASPNANPNGGTSGQHLFDVWYKDWTEVTFDLGKFRGQQVVLTFETDNCVPGGHFAYSYIALRNTCGGLQISGPVSACIGNTLTYSIPALTGANYNWQVPNGWTIMNGSDSNILKVQVVDNPSHTGTITVSEQNSCALLNTSLDVHMVPPTVAGTVNKDAEICSGDNASLNLTGNRGSILNWLSTTDGKNYTTISDTLPTYNAVNLTTTTTYVAVVQNGQSCTIDTALSAKILVDPLTVGGALSPGNFQFCLNQDKDALLKLEGQVGTPVNWQSSPDGTNWTDFSPPDQDSMYEIPSSLNQNIYYQVIVKSGVCPSKTSEPASVTIVPVAFPQATIDPADTLICYNTKATLNATITVGTNYSWTNTNTLSGQGDGNVGSLPMSLQATASPLSTTNYVFSVENAGCPNLRKDTFHIRVYQPILVNPGNDTSVVINQPLQLHASSNDTSALGDDFTWTPSLGLDNPNIPDPIGIYSAETDSVRYLVTATSRAYGCQGSAEILVKVFKTGPDIFVPNAFTPGGPTNYLFRPVPVGISRLQYFRVYNRWGQLVYSTSQMGQGWDGRLNGQLLPSGSYVWMVQGITYTNHVVFHKGVMVLVR